MQNIEFYFGHKMTIVTFCVVYVLPVRLGEFTKEYTINANKAGG